MKDKNSCVSWARILTLSDNARHSLKASNSNHSYFGIKTSFSGINRWISEICRDMNDKRQELLKNEPILAICYDNNQKWFARKYQSGGESSYNVKVTTKYAKYIFPYQIPD